MTAANISDKAGAKLLLVELFDAFSTLWLMWADTGCNGKPLEKYARTVAAVMVEVVARTPSRCSAVAGWWSGPSAG